MNSNTKPRKKPTSRINFELGKRDLSDIASTLTQVLDQSKMAELKRKIENATRTAVTEPPWEHATSLELKLRLERAAAALRNALEELAENQDAAGCLELGETSKLVKYALLPIVGMASGIERKLTPAHIDHPFGALKEQKVLDNAVNSVWHLQLWCSEAARSIEASRSIATGNTRVRSHREKLFVTLLAYIWFRFTGIPAKVKVGTLGDAKGGFVKFAQTAGRCVGIPLTDRIIIDQLRHLRRPSRAVKAPKTGP